MNMTHRKIGPRMSATTKTATTMATAALMALVLGAGSREASAADDVVDDAAARLAFFEAHCVKCHGPDKQKGKVRLDDMPPNAKGLTALERWETVLDVLENGDMPPEDAFAGGRGSGGAPDVSAHADASDEPVPVSQRGGRSAGAARGTVRVA